MRVTEERFLCESQTIRRVTGEGSHDPQGRPTYISREKGGREIRKITLF